MKLSGWVIAFRGCDQSEVEDAIFGRREAGFSDKPWDWLGSGSYFWENSYQRAMEWAKSMSARPRDPIKNPAVLGVIIDPGNCLDLVDAGCLELLKAAHAEFTESFRLVGATMPQNEARDEKDTDFVKRRLDCAVINYLHESRKEKSLTPFDTVRGPFLEGGELFPGSRLAAKAHVQWAVLQPKQSIVGYFKPRPGWFEF